MLLPTGTGPLEALEFLIVGSRGGTKAQCEVENAQADRPARGHRFSQCHQRICVKAKPHKPSRDDGSSKTDSGNLLSRRIEVPKDSFSSRFTPGLSAYPFPLSSPFYFFRRFSHGTTRWRRLALCDCGRGEKSLYVPKTESRPQ